MGGGAGESDHTISFGIFKGFLGRNSGRTLFLNIFNKCTARKPIVPGIFNVIEANIKVFI